MENFDINGIMDMISKMDKKELEEGLSKASKILESNERRRYIKKT